jgi:hypothetical protein
MTKYVLSETQNNESLLLPSKSNESLSLVPIAVKKMKPNDAKNKVVLKQRAELKSTKLCLTTLSFTMNCSSPQTILVSLQNLLEIVSRHPISELVSGARMGLLNRIMYDVRTCMKENKNLVNAPDAHATETIPAKVLLFKLNLNDGNVVCELYFHSYK